MIQKSTGSNRPYRRYCRVLRRLLANVADPKEVDRLTADQQVIARQLLDADPQERPQVFKDCLAGMGAAGNILQSDVFLVDPVNEPDPFAVSSVADLEGIMTGTTWEWQDWLPRGYVTMLVAKSGVGKSMFAIWGVVRSMLLGDPWPDGTLPEHDNDSKVLWIEAEHFHQGLHDRVMKAGLPANRILFPKQHPLDVVDFTNPADVEELRETIREYRPRLLVIDALSGTHGAKENENDSMLTVMKLFAQLAQEFNIALLLIHHCKKGGDGREIDLDSVRGASSVVQYARSVISLEKLDDSPDGVLQLKVIKASCVDKPQPIGVRIGDGKLEYMAAPISRGALSAMERAKDFLAEKLRIMPRQRCDLVREAEEKGISSSTLGRAREELELVTIDHDGKKCWAFPEERETSDFT